MIEPHWHDYNTACKTELLNYDYGTLLNQVDKKKSFSRNMEIAYDVMFSF